MTATPLNGPERQARAVMAIFTCLFVGTGAFMLIAPREVIALLNAISRQVAPGLPEAPLEFGRMWWMLSLAMMAMISYISASNWRDLRRHQGLIPVLLVSKATSSILGLSLFLISEPRMFVDLAVFLADFPLFVCGTVVYRRLNRAADCGASARSCQVGA